jgi:flagellar assembly factor FliW
VIDVGEEQVLRIKGGLLGFTNLNKYIIIRHHGQSPFVWLQSLERLELAFPLLDPHLIYPDYLLEISRENAEEIGIENEDDVAIFVLVAMRSNKKQIQLNMQGPLIVNRKNNLAMQFIDHGCRYSGVVELEPAVGKQIGDV